MAQFVQLADIRLDGGTQPRAAIQDDIVADYAEAFGRGDALPPMVLFFDGACYWLADGFHRYQAARSRSLGGLNCDVRQGTQRDAILYSVGANADHGLRRTDDDKRRAVLRLLNDPEWAAWADREIARHCRVSPTFVGKQRVGDTVHVDSMDRTFVHPKTQAPTTMRTENIGRRMEGPTATADPPAAPQSATPASEPLAVVTPAELTTEEQAVQKARREIARLSQDAMIDEIIGLRADLSDARAEVRKLKSERDDWKAKATEAMQGDLGRALGNAQRRAAQFEGRMNEYMAAVKRIERQLKTSQARVRELEQMPVEMAS